MLICFGISWPLSIIKLCRIKRADGKSRGFLLAVIVGYAAGIVAKCFRADGNFMHLEAVTILYALNLIMVAVDLWLVNKFKSMTV